MKLLELLGLSKRRSWQELVGLRPHMIDETAADSGYGKRKSYDVVDRIALIDVRGLLVNDEDWWDGYGCSTYDRITEEVRGAGDDPEVDGILLRVNSPGGECDNAYETAAAIVAVGKKKPVWSVAETSAYSAGYLLASAGSRIYVPPYTGGVGSIGVYGVHMDYSGMLEKYGVKPTFVEAGKGKTDRHPYKPLNAAAKERIQNEIDRLYGMFVDHVSAQRNIEGGKIREFGAALFAGSGAIEAGLADKFGNCVTALQDMRAHLNARAQAALLSGVAASAEAAGTTAAQAEAPAPTAEAVAAGVGIPVEEAAEAIQEANYQDPVVQAREATARRDAITAMCSLAGCASEAEGFIAAGLTVEAIGAELLARRATESEQHQIVSQLQPTTASAAGAASANLNDSPLVKRADEQAARHAAARKER